MSRADGKADNCTDNQENIAHYRERHSYDQGSDQYQHLHRSRLGFLGKERNRVSKNSTAALNNASAFSSKPECPAGLRDPGLSLLIVERFPTQRRKIRPSANPIPSAVNTAFVGFSRT